MGFTLKTDYKWIDVNLFAWRELLRTALDHGWEPEGELQEDGTYNWRLYFFNEMAEMGEKDCASLAEVLLRMAPIERRLIPLIEVVLPLLATGSVRIW
jgi:hypothetical protein